MRPDQRHAHSVNNVKLIVFLNLMFFLVGLLESMLSALIPEIIRSFQINYGLASVMPFAYFLAFTLLCIPAGIIASKYSSRNILVFALLSAFVGLSMFVVFLRYQTSVVSLFLTGSAAAIMQVTALPLIRNVCGAENLAFHTTLNQLMYSVGALCSPVIYSWLTSNMLHGARFFPLNMLSTVIPNGFEWTSAYWLLILYILFMLVMTFFIRFPSQVKTIASAPTGTQAYKELFRNKYVFFYFLTMVACVSFDQGILAWMSKFFQDVHGLDPLTEGASRLSFYWMMAIVGCFTGLIMLRFFDSRKVLAVLTAGAMITLLFALHGTTPVSKIAFPLISLFQAVFWPVIMSLAFNSVTKHHEVFSGFMFTAAFGGALGPVIIGSMGDVVGLGASLHYLFIPLIVVFSVAFWAKPLVAQKKSL